jgi:DNA topoisomerase-1
MGTIHQIWKSHVQNSKEKDDTKYDAEELKEISLEEVKNGSQIRIRKLCRKEKPAAKKPQLRKLQLQRNRQRRRNNIN